MVEDGGRVVGDDEDLGATGASDGTVATLAFNFVAIMGLIGRETGDVYLGRV